MSLANPSERAGETRDVADVACPFCACTCDDLQLRVEGDRIVEAFNACPAARMSFLGYRTPTGPACLIDGEPTAVGAGIERAARILAESRHPLIFGMGETTTEAHRAAVSLGERIGACIDFSGVEGGLSTIEALQSIGEVTCTLGEIRNRADLIVVWRADPLESHPRLFSRYALDPDGLFVPAGRGDRYCAVVDDRETRSAREAADQFLAIRPEGEVEALWALRALAAGIEVEAEVIESATGIPLATWQGLMERMKAARYGVVFYHVDGLAAHAVHSLTRDMNGLTRFVCVPLPPSGSNLVGARNVLAWMTGYPAAVSFAPGYPRYGPDEFGAFASLRDGRVDAVLTVGSEWEETPSPAREHLARVPRIILDSSDEAPPPDAAVFFQTARFGIGTAGTVYRMDGVPLPMRAVLASPLPSDVEILRAIEHRAIALIRTATEEARRWH